MTVGFRQVSDCVRSWVRPLFGIPGSTTRNRVWTGTVVKVRTRYYRSRYRARAEWGAGTQVNGRLRLRGPGRIVIGDRSVLGPGSGGNVIHAAGPGVVRIGEGCHLNGLNISATDNVTLGAGVQLRGNFRLERSGRITVGDGCDLDTLDIVATGDVTIGDRVKVRQWLHLHDAGHVAVGADCKINTLNVSATGDVIIGSGVNFRGATQIDGPGRIVIGDRCTVESVGLGVHTEGPTVTVRIGDECGINGLDVYATDDVTIGNRGMIGECSMMTTDFHSTRRDRWSPDAPVKRGAITVGTNVWIANRTVITKKVSIGDNSVISIGTIVREDVPANVIVSSHQQRIVKELPPKES